MEDGRTEGLLEGLGNALESKVGRRVLRWWRRRRGGSGRRRRRGGGGSADEGRRSKEARLGRTRDEPASGEHSRAIHLWGGGGGRWWPETKSSRSSAALSSSSHFPRSSPQPTATALELSCAESQSAAEWRRSRAQSSALRLRVVLQRPRWEISSPSAPSPPRLPLRDTPSCARYMPWDTVGARSRELTSRGAPGLARAASQEHVHPRGLCRVRCPPAGHL